MQPVERYQRQIAFLGIGSAGQARLSRARATIIGVGALGTAIANSLARAGFGFLRLVDGDRVEVSNLQRQTLFDESDAAAHAYKAEAAAAHIAAINAAVATEALVMRADSSSIDKLVQDVDVVLDGADNFDVRYLANDACRRLGIPWIYGGVLGDSGVTMNVLPESGPCLRCLMPDAPEPGTFPTTETVGILNQIVAVIGNLEAIEAMKIVVGSPDVRRSLVSISLWDASFHETMVERSPACPVCARL
ncbi:MAG: ThiF family adenylyltransferase [Spirochaetales bacterium]|nr:ThiF family adenylyltransferase [Spirochaetales bacterium]